ncbi:MAG: riboflavin synthase [Candidatus Roizmanbacteria bacterium]|uniref:Riboflavin synthase n=1 Tax=Candidatus Roizmanbacteria bacterium CG_4_9_14_0_2_um_filter_39_13 TaxID=1974839 RepID=A0A2M8F0C7_9BACT|nr:riboflavin synthase [Candidatus Roizmanbacteria bacterium]PIZ64578.1 MAG: riboflavin synthase [Candidatus Roizmanbacteria bacterium CG_4_10_14_0_2_um_filter_39_12]PJC32739.1 MAG: riboflavin synthase [Candidatus Roizmanbacteria bacterium CG_4_9_14_0_2_um_filter_39_13]
MFTGIISHIGTIKEKTKDTLHIEAPGDLYTKCTLGMSIAVNGICLTVASVENLSQFTVNFMPETEKKTTIQFAKKNELVNLELPVTTETLFAGHIVQGHVDTVSKILNIENEGNSHIFTFSSKPNFSKYMVDKGSVSVNGISLTIIQSLHDRFTIGIIPHTWANTMLHKSVIGDYVNIEVDVLAKYLEKLMIREEK